MWSTPCARTVFPEGFRIASEHVRAVILIDGGILWSPEFRLGSGRWVKPLAEAPWSGDPAMGEDEHLPPTMRVLGGAFLGLPFGGRGLEVEAHGWAARPPKFPHHGVAAASRWHVDVAHTERMLLRLDVAEPHPVAWIEQDIRCGDDRSEIRIEVRVETREDVRLPLGYHPILRMPDRPGDLRIEATFGTGFAFPAVLNPLGQAMPGAVFSTLSDVEGKAGPLDFSTLPHGAPAEDLLMMTKLRSPIQAHFLDEAYRLRLDWDRSALPNCVLWTHDRALGERPWGHRFRGVGIEPGAMAFDLAPTEYDTHHHAEETLTVAFQANEVRCFAFAMSVEEEQ
jgi:hypothetical protein